LNNIYGFVKKMRVLKPFDPWRSMLCTCRPKFSLHPYTGCSHFCLYCYASSYIGWKPSTPKKSFIQILEKDLRYMNNNLVVELSSSSDPYPPIESWMMLTRRAIELLVGKKIKILITTKSDIVGRDSDLLLKTPSAIMFTITTLDEELAKVIEPGAPSPWKRVEALKKLSERGLPVGVRIDPIIPSLNDDPRQLYELIDVVAHNGAKHIVTSTYKARMDSLKRLINAFPDKADYWRKLYVENGERVRGYMYLPRMLREKLLEPVVRHGLEKGLTVATCREGLGRYFLQAPSCDGQHLIKDHKIKV